ncbi:hypothetical protein M0804_000344 [Polistes exclamans]|nr:hypothetical protein M0804_000344 [Polistes exclamans]
MATVSSEVELRGWRVPMIRPFKKLVTLSFIREDSFGVPIVTQRRQDSLTIKTESGLFGTLKRHEKTLWTHPLPPSISTSRRVDDRVRSPNTLRCVTATTSLSISPSSPEEPVTLQEEKASRANKSPQLPPVGAICLDRRLVPGIIHPDNNTLLLNEA